MPYTAPLKPNDATINWSAEFTEWQPAPPSHVYSPKDEIEQIENLADAINNILPSTPRIAKVATTKPNASTIPDKIHAVMINYLSITQEWIKALPEMEILKRFYAGPVPEGLVQLEDNYIHNRRVISVDKQRLQEKLDRQFIAAQKHLKTKAYDHQFPPETFNKKDDPKITTENNYSAHDRLSPEKTDSCYRVGVASTQGNFRSAMEDVVVYKLLKISQDEKKINVPFYAVFDGHGGATCAEYLGNHLSEYLVEKLKDKLQEHPERGHLDLYNVLKLACVHVGENYFVDPKYDKSATAALFTLIIDGDIWTANVGDSRAALITKDETIVLSEDADLELEKYQKGVWKRGQQIAIHKDSTYRVNNLSMARAVGHDEYFSGISPRSTIVKIPKEKLSDGGNLLVLACDGLWDVATTEEAGTVVRDANREGLTGDQIAYRLVQMAARTGSSDNISVLVAEIDNKNRS